MPGVEAALALGVGLRSLAGAGQGVFAGGVRGVGEDGVGAEVEVGAVGGGGQHPLHLGPVFVGGVGGEVVEAAAGFCATGRALAAEAVEVVARVGRRFAVGRPVDVV